MSRRAHTHSMGCSIADSARWPVYLGHHLSEKAARGIANTINPRTVVQSNRTT